MIKKLQKLIILGLIILILNMMILNVYAEIDTNITISPTEPTSLSKITFTAKITGENVKDVKIYVQECNPKICYADWIIETMNSNGEDEYNTDVTLTHSDATYIYYWLEVTTDENTYNLQDEKTTLDLKIIDNGNNTNGSNNSPGFELFVLIFGILTVVFVFKKKRLK